MYRLAEPDLRKVSALLLCELAYGNQEIKRRTAEMLSVRPATGRVPQV
jgi:hypothetical protein